MSEDKGYPSRGVSRRGFLTVAVSAIVAGVVAGVGAYYAGTLAAPVKEVVKEVTRTVTSTTTLAPGAPVTSTVTVTPPPTTVTKTVTTTVTATATPTPITTTPREIVEAAKKEGRLVIYSPVPEPQQEALTKAFNKIFPEIVIEHYRASPGKVYEKFRTEAEAGKVACDLVHGPDHSVIATVFKEKGWLQPYVVQEIDKLVLKEPSGYWTHIYFYVLVFAYNSKLLTPDQAPKSWMDFVDPRWKGKISAPMDPRVGGGIAAKWDVWVNVFGMDYIRKLPEQNILETASWPASLEQIVKGEALWGETWQNNPYDLIIKTGAPLGVIIPKEGTFRSPGTYAIAKDAPHPNAAKLYLDWLVSEDGQKNLAEARGVFPLRRGVVVKPMLEVLGLYPEIKSIEDVKEIYRIDWLKLSGTLQEYVKIYDELFRK